MQQQSPTLASTRISPAIDKAEFRQAMSRLGAAVNIITTDGPAGRAGFTACAVCSVTDDPPTLLVCLNRSASVHQTVLANGTVCVNTLAEGHQALSNLFGGKTPMDARFAAAHWTRHATGAPALEDAVVVFDCTISQVTSVGTHDVLFCEIHALVVGEAPQGLMYFARQYHALDAAQPAASLAA